MKPFRPFWLWLLLEDLWRNLFCRFFHRRHRCYPEVWKEVSDWHCAECHPCGEIFDLLEDPLYMQWIEETRRGKEQP